MKRGEQRRRELLICAGTYKFSQVNLTLSLNTLKDLIPSHVNLNVFHILCYNILFLILILFSFEGLKITLRVHKPYEPSI